MGVETTVLLAAATVLWRTVETCLLATVIVLMVAARRERRALANDLASFRESEERLYGLGLVFEENLKAYFSETVGLEWRKLSDQEIAKILEQKAKERA